MKLPATHQKLRGGYYTPQPIGDFLAKWAIQSSTAAVLEPSCGDGVLLEAAAKRLLELGAPPHQVGYSLHAVEFIAEEARIASEKLKILDISLAEGHLHVGDFFARCKDLLSQDQKFDVIIGNPPFIRYQNFPEEHRSVAFQLMGRAGILPNRLMNAWVPFLVVATLLLKTKGRLAMVIPAELLQVNYAARLRLFLSEQFSEITLLTFKTLLFEGIQQEVVLLLGERNGNEHSGVRTIELGTMDDLVSYQHTEFTLDQLKPMSHSTEKWTQYFLDADEITLLRDLRYDARLTMAGQVIEVDVGIVTGLNDFFVLLDSQAQQNGLTDYVCPLVGRSGQLQGLSFTECDWQSQVEQNLPAYLLQAPDVAFDQLPPVVRTYVAEGEKKNYHTGYKCRIRKRWYIVPSVWIPDAFMLRQVHAFPKIVLNEAGVTCTDTIHRVRFKPGVDGSLVTSAFTNSLTFAFAEVIGRSYGGGVLELEPNEAETLPLPLTNSEALDLDQLDKLVRAGEIETVLNLTDDVLLIRGLGLTRYETHMLRHMWQKLRNRRIQRKYKRSPNSQPISELVEFAAD